MFARLTKFAWNVLFFSILLLDYAARSVEEIKGLVHFQIQISL